MVLFDLVYSFLDCLFLDVYIIYMTRFQQPSVAFFFVYIRDQVLSVKM